jgi:DNA-binding beta-propeller fold protein YncE
MKTKRKCVAISILILAVCLIGIVLLFLIRTPASYIWVMDAGMLLNETHLVKMCPNGTRIIQVQFGQSGAIGVDPRSGSIWAPELNDMERANFDQVVNVDADGNIINRYQGYRTGVIAVDPNDGSVWVGLPNERQIMRLDSNGKRILQMAGFPAPASIAVDPRDSSVWIADSTSKTVVHLTANGVELSRTKTTGFFSDAPHQIAVDPRNGDVWYTGFHTGNVYKLSSGGHLLAKIGSFDRPVSVSVNPSDGSVWVADYSVEKSGEVVKLDSDGRTILRVILDNPPHIVGVNPFDGTVWVGIDGAMLKLSDEGKTLKTVAGFTSPHSIAFVESADDLVARLRFARICYGHFR